MLKNVIKTSLYRIEFEIRDEPWLGRPVKGYQVYVLNPYTACGDKNQVRLALAKAQVHEVLEAVGLDEVDRGRTGAVRAWIGGRQDQLGQVFGLVLRRAEVQELHVVAREGGKQKEKMFF